jgi:hypothetical protein
MWASKAVKFGYKWEIGNGGTIHFWEGTWFINAPFATKYYDFYFASNQQIKIVVSL